MSTNDLRIAFNQRMNSFSFSPAPPILWPNITSTPPSDGLWIEFSFFPGKPRTPRWDGVCSDRLGFAQALIGFRPNTGTVGAGELADAVAEHFPVGLQVGDVRIIEAPQVGADFKNESGGYFYIPVTIRYRGNF